MRNVETAALLVLPLLALAALLITLSRAIQSVGLS